MEKKKRDNMISADIFDSTGIFRVYAGEYQENAMNAFEEIEPPAFVSVLGKGRLYSPEEGVNFLSVRPEMVCSVDEETRNYWIYITAKHTLKRIDAIEDTIELSELSTEKLIQMGYHAELAEGIAIARREYGNVDIDYYRRMVIDALGYVLSAERSVYANTQDIQDKLLEYIDKIDTGEGAPIGDIIAWGRDTGIDENTIEEIVNILLSRGLIYEPSLGKLKKA